MKAKITALVGAMLLVSAGLAADDNPLIGKWKLNPAKTKYSAGAPPKNQIITYDMVGDALRLTAEIDNAQGHRDFAAGQTVRLRRIDAFTTERSTYFKGKQIGTVTEVVSKNGKTLTRTQKGANPQGQPIDNVQVLDKQ